MSSVIYRASTLVICSQLTTDRREAEWTGFGDRLGETSEENTLHHSGTTGKTIVRPLRSSLAYRQRFSCSLQRPRETGAVRSKRSKPALTKVRTCTFQLKNMYDPH